MAERHIGPEVVYEPGLDKVHEFEYGKLPCRLVQALSRQPHSKQSALLTWRT